MKTILTTAALALCCVPAAVANTVLLDEDFNDGSHWQESFPVYIEGDHLNPAANIFPYFTDDSGKARPWWKIKDSNASSDGFLASHSIYSTPGQSNDWIQSRSLDIESEGFTLSFGAQSCLMRSGNRLSDLHVFITEEPLTAGALPDAAEAVMLIEQVSAGADAGNLEGEFTEYSLSLDPWVGKTVYVAFANLNSDRDILCIDNVKVERLDAAELLVESDAEAFDGEMYTTAGQVALHGSVTATDNLGAWSLGLAYGDTSLTVCSGTSMQAGDSVPFEVVVDAPAGELTEWVATLNVEDCIPVVRSEQVFSLAHRPEHRVLVEESTGLWCGNCPMGIYNMEELSEHPDTRDWAIPVSVHITGSGSDFLVDEQYSYILGLTYAPAYRIERDRVVRGFAPATDTKEFDPTRPNTLGSLMTEHHNALTLFDIDMEAEWVVERNDTTGVTCRVTVSAARDYDTSRYAIGLIMKENNVHANNSPLMAQENYLSGQQFETTVGGWTEQGKKVLNVRYHDVARGVWGFNGLDNSLPAYMKEGEGHTFSHTVAVPDTYYEQNGLVGNPAVKTEFVTMVAFVVDTETQDVVNAVAVPMSDKASVRYTNFGDTGAVQGAGTDDSSDTEWYTLQGVRVSQPSAPGLYLRRQGGRTDKVMTR